MVRQHHQLNGHEFEQIPGDSEGQGRLECCSPWGCKELDTIKQMNNNKHFFDSPDYAPLHEPMKLLSIVQLFVTHGLQHAMLPCPSLSPEACSDSCPLSW